MSTSIRTTTPNSVADRVGRYTYFVLLLVATFRFPLSPEAGLDPSWRMVLGKALMDGWQAGKDLVFTYGPLGGLMGNTYFNKTFFWPLICWQLTTSLIFCSAIYYQGIRLCSYNRGGFWGFMLLIGIGYIDALHMIVICLLSFKLLRDLGRSPNRWITASILAFLAVMGMAKFTNLALSTFSITVLIIHELSVRRWRGAFYLASWFFGSFLTLWVICRQHLLNLPAYLINSIEISSGYEMTMGLTTPSPQLYIGLVILFTLIAYIIIYIWKKSDHRRSIAGLFILGAFLYINWKHSFIRSDGHTIGFFICALFLFTSFPKLLDDEPAHRRLQHGLFIGASCLCLIAIDLTLPGFCRGLFGRTEAQIYENITKALDFKATQLGYEKQLTQELYNYNLPHIKKTVGRDTLDVFGFRQAVALYNDFNYRPRPIFQSYSAYTPKLAKLNLDYYASSAAPEYLLMKIETIDGRYPSLDDSLCLHLITQRYRFVVSEKNFSLWRRAPDPFDPSTLTITHKATVDLVLGQPLDLANFLTEPLWITLDISTSLLGRIRNLFYKPPIIRLELQDNHDAITNFRLPQPQGRTGFILNPMIENNESLISFSGKPMNRVRRLTILVDKSDEKYVNTQASLRVSALRPSVPIVENTEQLEKRRFYMFMNAPIAYKALTPISETYIDNERVMILHAPSEMIFSIPPKAKTVKGSFGLMETTYTKGGQTDGAEFVVSWSNGRDSIELYRRRLDPLHNQNDQGLQHFSVQLPSRSGGKIYLRINNGPQNNTAWDWTGWTGISID